MPTEIPNSKPYSDSCLHTQEIGLAAACMADDLIPRLKITDISVFVDGDDRKSVFVFPTNDDVARVFKDWCDCLNGKTVDSHTAKIFRAFAYWNNFVNIIKQERLAPRPDSIPEGLEWTNNTKVPAAALALMPGPVVGYDRLVRMVYRNGRECGFVVRTGEVTKAFENPDEYISLNPDSPLSYVVAGFYHRDHIRDLVKQVPARHVFHEGTETHVISEPTKPTKEIPCRA